MKIGSLFSGYGGLDMGVQAVLDGDIVWHSDIDKGSCKLLEYRFPDVPNLGDISTVDWSQVEPVDVLTGGFPCQDVSAAGKRAGIRPGTRSGLWTQFAYAISQLRPSLVVIENVRGLLSAKAHSDVEPCAWCVGDDSDGALRALGAVLGDLADLGYDASWHGLRAADVGAPHGRFRVFITAYPNDGAGHGKRACAESRQGGEAGADSDGRLNLRGGTREDQRAVSNSDGRGAAAALLPTPTSSDTNGAGSHGDGGLDLRTAVALLPTPCAQPSGNSPEDHLRKKPGRGVVTDLAVLVENDLIRTGGIPHARTTEDGPSEAMRDVRQAADSQPACSPRGPEPGEQRSVEPDDALRELSPEAPLAGGSRGVEWGPYTDAIRRWESVLGREAPLPTQLSAKGNAQLSPRFVEFLMGLPAGWVTDVPDLSRNDMLKLCGNGVVPQQAEAALRLLLAREAVAA